MRIIIKLFILYLSIKNFFFKENPELNKIYFSYLKNFFFFLLFYWSFKIIFNFNMLWSNEGIFNYGIEIYILRIK
jgi:hypothetical protein